MLGAISSSTAAIAQNNGNNHDRVNILPVGPKFPYAHDLINSIQNFRHSGGWGGLSLFKLMYNETVHYFADKVK
jgi:hypothetical protein